MYFSGIMAEKLSLRLFVHFMGKDYLCPATPKCIGI